MTFQKLIGSVNAVKSILFTLSNYSICNSPITLLDSLIPFIQHFPYKISCVTASCCFLSLSKFISHPKLVSFHLWYLCHNGPQNVITTFIILIISDISWNIMVIRTFRWCDVQQVVTRAGVIDKLYRHPPAAGLHSSTKPPRGIESINRY